MQTKNGSDAQLETILARALENIRRIVERDAEFRLYLGKLFDSDHVTKFHDHSGACGFVATPPNAVPVSVVSLYEQPSSGGKQLVLALSAMHEPLYTPNEEQLKDCRLVIALKHIDDRRITFFEPYDVESIRYEMICILSKLRLDGSARDLIKEKFGPLAN